jgi:hypothetical protein
MAVPAALYLCWLVPQKHAPVGAFQWQRTSLSPWYLDLARQRVPAALRAVAVGLVVGKPLGILAACWLVLRVGLATLTAGIGRRQLLVLGVVAGVGFTMALLIAQLAFETPALLGAAKWGVLTGSGVAGWRPRSWGTCCCRLRTPRQPPCSPTKPRLRPTSEAGPLHSRPEKAGRFFTRGVGFTAAPLLQRRSA